MVSFTAVYKGNLKCEAVHGPSHTAITTDAPVDIGGSGSTFSPTDLVATSLLTCIMTTMALVAERNCLKLDGMSGTAEKIMRSTPPRRIDTLKLSLRMPIPQDHPLREKLEHAAHSCPVHLSLHPDITQSISWEWQE